MVVTGTMRRDKMVLILQIFKNRRLEMVKDDEARDNHTFWDGRWSYSVDESCGISRYMLQWIDYVELNVGCF